jgi:hypothetical protein
MKYLYKISSIIATAALVMGLSFSASFAQQNNQTQQSQSQSQSNTLQGKVVNSQSNKAVSNAKVMILKANNNGSQNNKMNQDTTNQYNANNSQRDSSNQYNANNSRQDTSNQYNANNQNNNMNGNQSAQMSATTNQKGHFKIQNLPSGTYTIKVKADGYQTWKKQATVKKNGFITVKLKKSS